MMGAALSETEYLKGRHIKSAFLAHASMSALRDAVWKAACWLASCTHLCHTVYHPTVRQCGWLQGLQAENAGAIGVMI